MDFEAIEKKVIQQMDDGQKELKSDFRSECKHVWIDGAGSYCKLMPINPGRRIFTRTDCYGRQPCVNCNGKFEKEVI